VKKKSTSSNINRASANSCTPSWSTSSLGS